MSDTPYIYNDDLRAGPTEYLRVVVERDRGEYDYIAYVWGDALDISCRENDAEIVVDNMLCSLESLGFDGTVEVDGINGIRTAALGKTEYFKELFPDNIP